MLNNKGFAVSSVLYTLLIAFLLFLGAALAQFSASSSLIGKANDDLVNGTSFEALQVKPSGACENGNKWYQYSDGKTDVKTSNTIVRIKSKYGTMYWPKDFKGSNFLVNLVNGDESFSATTSISNNGKIEAYVENPGSNSADTDDKNPDSNSVDTDGMKLKISFKDTTTGAFAKYGNVEDCGNNYKCMAIYDLCG